MRFWDTSAVVPLCVSEPATPAVRRLLDRDPAIFVWWATRTECLSALTRLHRDGRLKATEEQQARRALLALASSWSEVLPSERLRGRAERLLATHALRAADAFQLAAALLCARGDTAHLEIVSLDDRLRAASSREGFSLLP